MTKTMYLTIHPNKEKIAKWFYFFDLLDNDTKTKIGAWEKIAVTDFHYLKEVFIKREMKVDLDDVSFIFNYFKFLYKTSQTSFNTECTKLDEAARDLWPLFQLINSKEKLNRISIQTKDFINIKISSPVALDSLQHIFDVALKGNPYWKKTLDYILYLNKSGQLDHLLKRRTGNKIDYTGTVIKQSVTLFKNYLKENCKTKNKKEASLYSIIGGILESIELIEIYNGKFYKSKAEYYNQKSRYLDLDESLKKTPNLQNELFPPHFLIILNKDLII